MDACQHGLCTNTHMRYLLLHNENFFQRGCGDVWLVRTMAMLKALQGWLKAPLRDLYGTRIANIWARRHKVKP